MTQPVYRQRRQIPNLAQLRPLLRIEPPRLGRTARLNRAHTIGDLRAQARSRVPRSVFDYVDGAAEGEVSLRRARDAFGRVEFRPSILQDVGTPDLSTTLLGEPAPMPLVLAPTGFTRMMHHEGERAVARAAADAGVPYTLSTMGTTTPEDLAAAVPDGRNWFQLYMWRDRGASKELLQRARAAGFDTLMLTVDSPVAGARMRDLRNGLTIPPALRVKTLADMARRPAWWINLLTTEPLSFASLNSTDGPLREMVNRIFDPALTFADLEWLRTEWPGHLVVKGVQTAEDAAAVVAGGADGVVISNHGGRQLDYAPNPLEELPEVREVIGGRAEIYLDGGITRGADIIAAVAAGADACLVGRSYLYGLMAGGYQGVARALHILRTEMLRTLQLLGSPSVAALEPARVRLRPHP